jgi:hypothetical protein
MKIIFNHNNGIFTKDGNSLLEVYAKQEDESCEFMFENGWLPFRGSWYQTKSSRLKLSPVSSRRKKELSKIKIAIDNEKSLCKLVERAKSFGKFDEKYLQEYLQLDHIKIWFDDCFCSIVNIVDKIPYYTHMIWDESNKSNSYGTLSFYFMIDHFLSKGAAYLYTSEYYPEFSYKKNLQGFEYWNGYCWVNNESKN